MRIRFITSTPWNVERGSGTYVGIAALVASLRSLGASVEMITPSFSLPIYTLQRLIFNRTLAFRSKSDCDITVGFDMDGYTIANHRGIHVAAIKGVIADEMRFESGLTRATMQIQAACEKLHVQRAQAVITTSEYSANSIRELYGVHQNPIVIPELIDLASWNQISVANPARPAAGKFVVFSVCRFYPRKRLSVLLRAAAVLRPKIPGVELRIIGGGPEEQKLKALCRSLDIHVVWLGNVSRSELAREYNQCDVFCLPSVQEGFGLVFLEAMASGKPIVAARAGAVPEVVKHGLLADADDTDSLANAIEKLYRLPRLREELGAKSREYVRRFDSQIVGTQFLQELERILACSDPCWPK